MKQMKIAVCDDEKILVDQLVKMIVEYASHMADTEITTDHYYSAFALEEALSLGKVYDLVFLDIQLGKENGICLGSDIVRKLNDTKIIFMTGYINYVEDIFTIQPFALLLKPLTQERVEAVLEKARHSSSDKEEHFLSIKTKEGYFKISIDKICYVESEKRYLNIHGSDGETYRTILTMQEIGEQLPDYFVRSHRGYYVNKYKIKTLKERSAVMTDGSILPVNKDMYRELQQWFMDRCWEE